VPSSHADGRPHSSGAEPLQDREGFLGPKLAGVDLEIDGLISGVHVGLRHPPQGGERSLERKAITGDAREPDDRNANSSVLV
jgi:hypothetical protein